MAIESRPRVQDDRERPDPRRGLQLRHPQARRRVRRRHQQAARDDLRRARQGPPQRGPDGHGPGLPRRRDRRPASIATCRPDVPPDDWDMRRAVRELVRPWAWPATRSPRTRSGTSAAARRSPSISRTLADAHARAKREARTARSLGARRAAGAAAHDRLDLGRAPDRGRRHAAAASACAATPRRTRSTRSRRRRSRLYEELRGLIRHQVATTIFRVSIGPPAAATAPGRRGPVQPAAPARRPAGGADRHGRRSAPPGPRPVGRAGGADRGSRSSRPAGAEAAAGGAAPRPMRRRGRAGAAERPAGYTPAGAGWAATTRAGAAPG